MTEDLKSLITFPQIQVTYNQLREGVINENTCLDFLSTFLSMAKVELKAEEVLKHFQDEENKIVVLDVIKKKKLKKWVSNFDAKNTDDYRKRSLFNQYQRILINEGKEELAYKLKKEVYNILDATPRPDPGIAWRYNGLVFGKVQSGKTSNFIGLIAKAIDVGYDFIIILAGIPEDLRQQTQERLDKYIFRRELNISGNNYNLLDEEFEASKALNLNPLTYAADKEGNARREGEFKRTVFKTGNVNNDGPSIMIVKKNTSILQNEILPYLVNACDENRDSHDRKINQKTCLIIDDECDNASVLAQSKKEYISGEEKKAINLNIRRIINLFNRVTYIGYTATPQNVVMQNIESIEKLDTLNYRDQSITYKIEKNLTLYPEDFIQILEPSEGYLGLNEFLNESKDYIKIIDEKYLPETKDEDYIINKPLIDACQHFISCIYIRKHLWKEEKVNNSMLLHPSSLKSNLEQLKDLMESFRTSLVGDANRGEEKSEYFKIFKEKVRMYGNHSPNFKSYIDIIENIEVLSVHSGKQASTLNFKIPRDRIIVGGNKLSRGFTVEGLSVSYFFRRSSRLDSLHQMARWFGYRGKMNKLIKVYLPQEDKDYFEFLQGLDNNLMDQIYYMNFEEMDPYNFGLSLLYDPDLLGYNRDTRRRMDITDPNKSRHFEKGANFSRPLILRSLLNNYTENENNVSKVADWIENLKKLHTPFTLNINKQERIYDKQSLLIGKGNIYFTGISFDKVLALFDSLTFYDKAQITKDAKEFFDSNRNAINPETQNWSIMISRKEDTKELTPPFYRDRTYVLKDGSKDEIYISSIVDSKELKEDIFDLIENKEQLKEFMIKTKGKNELQELNKLRKQKGINLLKIYFTQLNKSKDKDQAIKVDPAVILGFIIPTQITTLKRK
jgi:hypothetical protein